MNTDSRGNNNVVVEMNERFMDRIGGRTCEKLFIVDLNSAARSIHMMYWSYSASYRQNKPSITVA